MRAVIKKEDILPILSQIQGILEKRSALPVFANILLSAESGGKTTVYASDSELSFSAHFKGEAKKEGSLVADGKKLFEIVRELSPEPFELSAAANHQLTLKQNQSLFKIPGLNPEDFPKIPPLKQKSRQSLLAEDMMEVIEKTLYCVSLDESRYHLTGVFLERSGDKYRFVATDGHRMSLVDAAGEKSAALSEGIIIPRKGLQEIKKMLAPAEKGDKLDLYIEKPRLLAQFKNQSLSVRLIEGQYPDYKSLLPKDKGKDIVISTEAFLSSLRRISVLTSARFKGVNFTFRKGRLAIYFSHPEIGEASEELDCGYQGEELAIRFNSKYILDILQSISEEKTKITLRDSQSPGLFQAESNKRCVCLVMPMKL